jgi:hypothetical protein
MLRSTLSINNIYLAENSSSDGQVHYRKGKIMDKHRIEKEIKKIISFKAKNLIDSSKRISMYDVYKAISDKKRKRIFVENKRCKGNDYKLFMINNEIPNDNAFDDNWDWSYAYDDSDYWNDSWEFEWD